MTRKPLTFSLAIALFAPVFVTGAFDAAQDDARKQAQQAAARIRELQAEADRLAAQTRTILTELRSLELQREIKTQEVTKTNAELAQASAAVDEAAARLAALEAQRQAETPGMRQRLVELYKRGRGGYARLLLGAGDLRAIGRLTRGITAMARIDRMRIDEHRRLLQAQRAALEQAQAQRAALEKARQEAAGARGALDRAVAAHNRRLDELDRQRDAAAVFLGELQAAQGALQDKVSALPGGAAPILPIGPRKGALDWPLRGRVVTRFGRSAAGRFGTAVVRNGIDIAADEGAPIRAVHGGSVAYAAPFTGYGMLVIIDHGENAFTLYGHLSEALATAGAQVEPGAVIGRSGRTPAGVPALYFELRIDGRPVDPLQWLRSTR